MNIYRLLFTISFFIFLVGCSDAYEKRSTTNDTSIHLYVDDYSEYGTEIIAYFCDKELKNAAILIKNINNETLINYIFTNDSIISNELLLIYQQPITPDKKISTDTLYDELYDSVHHVDYIMDYEGNIIYKDDSSHNITNFYQTFIRTLAPFVKSSRLEKD